MKNIYDQVKLFYDQENEWEPVIEQELVEGFFRQKAWQGLTDEKLQNIWKNLRMFIMYLEYEETRDLENISLEDYSLLIEWLDDNITDFVKDLAAVREFFAVLIDFYRYLISKKVISNLLGLEQAAKEIAGGDTLNLKALEDELEPAELFVDKPVDLSQGLSELSSHTAQLVGEMVEQLMSKLGTYFQHRSFNDDFERALYLYTGPLDNVPEEGQEEFWLGFWDYFLFDYHLMQDDTTPLNHFNLDYGDKLTPDEKRILNDLLSAQFTVFYVNRVVNHDWVECINLFTEEKFELPFMFDLTSLKKMLFFGHVFSRGLMMINYVTSMEVSTRLRRRIKDEVIRQHKVFQIQEPEADMQGFFTRHALVVRHTIDILVTLAKVNVTPAAQLERKFPPALEPRTANEEVTKWIEKGSLKYNFSRQDIKLMQRLWFDFNQRDKLLVRKPAVWAVAVMYTYMKLNYSSNFHMGEIAEHLDISVGSVRTNSHRIFDKLGLESFDPRYLSEEGFVFSLFMP
ncbi:MAG: hypothetical protein LLG02_06730 [Pelosinus sp.]|nr:hypothetical protein [Pelosinus sp.]